MAEWGRKEYRKKWPSRRPLWTLDAILLTPVFLAAMLAWQYERSWTAAERLYLTDYLKSGARSQTSARSMDKYTLLEGMDAKGRGRLLVGEEIEPVTGPDGKEGWRLTVQGAKDSIARLQWVTATFNDRGLHRLMGETVYADQTSWEFYRKAPAAVVMLA